MSEVPVSSLTMTGTLLACSSWVFLCTLHVSVVSSLTLRDLTVYSLNFGVLCTLLRVSLAYLIFLQSCFPLGLVVSSACEAGVAHVVVLFAGLYDRAYVERVALVLILSSWFFSVFSPTAVPAVLVVMSYSLLCICAYRITTLDVFESQASMCERWSFGVASEYLSDFHVILAVRVQG